MENISFSNNQNCCNTNATLQACANGVPYLLIVKEGCCNDEILQYLNLDTGLIEATRPTGFSIGECTTTTNDCGIEHTYVEHTTAVTDLSVSGCILTLKYLDEEGVETTKQVDLSTCGGNIPPYRTCYEIVGAATRNNSKIGPFVSNPGPSGIRRAISKLEIKSQPSGTICQTINLTTPIEIYDGTNWINTDTIKTQLINSGYFDAVKTCIGCPDLEISVHVSSDNQTLRIFQYSPTNSCDTAILNNFVTIYLKRLDTGVIYNDYDVLSTTNAWVDTSATNNFSVYYIDGVVTYWENGAKVTDATRLAELQALVASATESGIVCCDDCGGEETITTLAGTLTTGNTIGTYTNEAGTATIIRETITSIETNADGSFTYRNEAGVATTIPVTPCKSYYETETFTATAGQTTFTLLATPSGDVRFSRNGATLSDGSAVVAGNLVTYVPTANNTEPLLVNDRIEISYIYTICSGTASVADGSETKVTAGTGITVTGTGTIADPYIVSSTATTAGIGNFGTLTSNTGQAVTTGSVIDMVAAPANQTYGTLVVPDPATNTLLLKAGYIYEVDSELQMSFANSSTWLNYAIYTGTTAASQTTTIGTPGKIRPNNEAATARYDTNAQAFVVATADTYISLKVTNGSGTTNSFEGGTYFKAKVIGKI